LSARERERRRLRGGRARREDGPDERTLGDAVREHDARRGGRGRGAYVLERLEGPDAPDVGGDGVALERVAGGDPDRFPDDVHGARSDARCAASRLASRFFARRIRRSFPSTSCSASIARYVARSSPARATSTSSAATVIRFEAAISAMAASTSAGEASTRSAD